LTKELEHSFVEQLEKHQNIVHKVCRLYTNNQDWMYRVGLNTAITLYRKGKRSISTQHMDDVLFKVKAEEYDDTEEQQLKLLYKAVHQLNDIEKALVFLYLEDKNYREISSTMGISEVNAIGKRIRLSILDLQQKTFTR